MKKILITGAGSYIGTSFEKYINTNFPDEYTIDTVDMIGDGWKEKNFSPYDAVFHVAGIAHQKESKKNEHLYYEVNRDLAIETAKKSIEDGVKQFVFLSSMSVYGLNEGVITKDTTPYPKNNYGKSKLQAEELLKELTKNKIRLVILRPPMVYGKNCRGNYQVLRKIALKFPFFPKVKNMRSMIYIENLCEFVRILIKNEEIGTFFPQNKEYCNTSEIVKTISETHVKKIKLVSCVGWALQPLKHCINTVGKAFGTLIYDRSMSEYTENYCICDFNESLKRTEGTI